MSFTPRPWQDANKRRAGILQRKEGDEWLTTRLGLKCRQTFG